MENIHILVATPCYGNLLNTNYASSIFDLKDLCYSLGIRLTIRLIGNESLITRGRNYYVNLLLTKKEYTHLLFIDADIGFYAKNIIEMVQFKQDIVCIPYPKKSINFTKLAKYANYKNMNTDKLQAVCQDYVVNFLNTSAEIKNGFIQCSYGGTGLMLIERNVIETMKIKYSNTKYSNDVGGYNENEVSKDNFYALFDCFICPKSNRYLSEDYAFCQRAIECNFKIWANLNAPITHHGGHCFLGHFGQTLMMGVEENEVSISQQEPPPPPPPQPATPQPVKKEKIKFVNSI